MSPSFSAKNGVHYRFYVSSALLRGRKADVGSVGRVPAAEIESTVLTALETHQQQGQSDRALASIEDVERVVIAHDHLLITTASTADRDGTNQKFRIAWSTKAKDATAAIEDNGVPEAARNESLIQSIVRAHAWVDCLCEGTYESIEQLAEENRLHPKVVRQASGSRSFHRRLRQPFWNADSRRDFRWRKSRNSLRCLGRSIGACSTDFG
jgi:hypothetical protein